METMNGGQGGEDARQIAPGVARSDYRAGWAIVVIALVFLFCPGCGEGEGAESFAVMVLIGAALAGWVARSILAGRELRERDSAERTLTAERDFALQAKAQAFEESQRQIADLKSKLETAHLIAFPLCESYERLFLLVGLSKDDLIDNDPEGMEAMLTQRIERLIAAADACAELLSGPNAPGEHTAARVALRATGRLGGATAEPKP